MDKFVIGRVVTAIDYPSIKFSIRLAVANALTTRRGSSKKQSLTLQVLLPSVRCGLFDQGCNLLRPGYEDGVTGA
jgi:hypothetical protein